ncbi:MAG: SoxR reducing system RseC family protein [Pseudomonadota bacterium]|nr:SoxR reducing system RseC family protein [Pseudomonadota bacterium]
MNEESGRVVRVDGPWAWVETERVSTCGGCAARSGCGTSVLASVLGRRTTRVRAINQAGAVPGDRVNVAVRDGQIVRGSLAVYGLPVVLMIVFAMVGKGMTQGEGGSILMGMAGLAAGFAWVRYLSSRASQDPDHQPVVVGLIPSEGLGPRPGTH